LKKEKKDDTAFLAFVSSIENCTPQSEFRFYAIDENNMFDTVPELKPYDQYVCSFSKTRIQSISGGHIQKTVTDAVVL
jgi:hypothetical protein